MKATPPTSLRRRAYIDLRRRILDAELLPGTALSEYPLSQMLRISRTPVRAALQDLEREGLVVSVPQRGSFVAALTARDVVEIYQVREQLEALAARTAAERMDPFVAGALEAELMSAKQAGDLSPELAFEADVHLHRQLVSTLMNRRIEQILANLDDQVHIIRHLAPGASGRLRSMTLEHLDIVQAILASDPGRAEEAMRVHLKSARDNALRLTLPAQV